MEGPSSFQFQKTRSTKANRSSLLACAGMACFFAWMSSLLCLGGVASGSAGDGAALYNPFFAATTIAATVTCIALCLPPRRWQRALGTRPALCVLAGLAVASAVCVVLLGMRILPVVSAYYLFGAIIGLSIAAFLMQWLIMLSDFDPMTVTTILLVTVIAGLASFVAIHYLRKALDSSPLTTAVSLALLAGSSALFASAHGYLHPIESSREEQGTFLPRIAFFAFASSLVSQFLITFTVGYNNDVFFGQNGVIATGFGSRIMTERLGCLLCAIVILSLLAVARKSSRRAGYIVLVIYRIIVFALIMALGFSLAQLSQFAPPFVTYTLALLAYFLSQTGSWMIVLHSGFLFGHDTVGLIGYTLMAQFFGYFLGFSLYDALKTSLFGSTAFTVGALIGLLTLVCLAFLFVFTERDVNRVSHVSVAEPSESAETPSLEQRCLLAQKRFALTERETEILTLLARGRNAVAIQEHLCISYNTAKAHRYNIYTKMSVHSQQELLTLMEDLR